VPPQRAERGKVRPALEAAVFTVVVAPLVYREGGGGEEGFLGVGTDEVECEGVFVVGRRSEVGALAGAAEEEGCAAWVAETGAGAAGEAVEAARILGWWLV